MNTLDMLLQQMKWPQAYHSFLKSYHSLQASLRMFQMLNELNHQQTTVPVSLNVSGSTVTSTPELTAESVGSLHINPAPSNPLLKRRIHKVTAEVPAALGKSFGYQGNERWIQIFLANEPINKPICSDGRTIYCGTLLAWELFLDSIIHTFDRLEDTPHQVAFLFDQWECNLYYGAQETINELLSNPECLALLQSSTVSMPRGESTQIRDFAAIFILGGILGATVAGVLFSIGLGLFQATH